MATERLTDWTFRWLDRRLLLVSVPLGLLAFEGFTQRLDYAGWPSLFGFPLAWMRWNGASLEYLFSPRALAVDTACFQLAAYAAVSAAAQGLQRRYRVRARRAFVALAWLGLLGATGAALAAHGLGLGFSPLTPQQPTLGPPAGDEADHPLRGRHFGTASALHQGTYDIPE